MCFIPKWRRNAFEGTEWLLDYEACRNWYDTLQTEAWPLLWTLTRWVFHVPHSSIYKTWCFLSGHVILSNAIFSQYAMIWEELVNFFSPWIMKMNADQVPWFFIVTEFIHRHTFSSSWLWNVYFFLIQKYTALHMDIKNTSSASHLTHCSEVMLICREADQTYSELLILHRGRNKPVSGVIWWGHVFVTSRTTRFHGKYPSSVVHH